MIGLGILTYGLLSHKRWALWVGGVWTAVNVAYVVHRQSQVQR